MPNQMYEQRQGWAELLTDLALEQPADGLIGLCELGDEVDWCAPVSSLLEQRGVPLPVSGVTGYGISQFGPRLTSYPSGAGVTVFTAVTTTGRELMTFRGMLAARGLQIQRMLSLVHCGPTLPRGILGMPYAAAVHFPLPITPATACFECLLGRPVRPLAS